MLISRWYYYVSSIPTLFWGITNWHTVLFGLLSMRPFTVTLRSKLAFSVRSIMDIWIIKETCLDHDYEVHGIDLEDGWIVIDIGAGIGDFTIYAASELPNGKVYAFEPFPESYELLINNIKKNKISNVFAFPYAIGSTEGEMYLNTKSEVAVKHSTAVLTLDKTLTVKAVTLDSILTNIDKCDLLKLDCEGAEYEILFSLSKKGFSKIQHISMEYHDGITKFSHQDLVEFLKNNGFSTTTTNNRAHHDIGFLYASQNFF